MDERKLSELFRDSVPDAPPPTFNAQDVAAESGRQTLRKRNALLGGSALGVLLVAGIAVLSVALWGGTDSNEQATSAGAPMVARSTGNGELVPNEVPNDRAQPPAADGGVQQDPSFSAELPKQGGAPTGNAGPSGPGSTPSGCGQADRELAAALAGELPAAANIEPVAATVLCPVGSRAAAVPLTDGTRTGVVTVVLTPEGRSVDYPVNGSPQGAVVGVGSAGGGKRVYVITEPSGASIEAPFAAEVSRAAERLATRY
jgi:hypothetical protein